MPPSYYSSFVLMRLVTVALFGILLQPVPSAFWLEVESLMQVPTIVKVAVAPLLGSFCATSVEFLTHLARRTPAPSSPVYWPLKIIVGWIAGAFIGSGTIGLINAKPESLAFWSGVTIYGVLALTLRKQEKELNDLDDKNDAT